MVKGTFTVTGKDIDKMVSGTFLAFSSLAHVQDFGQTVVVVGERFSGWQETELVHTAVVHYSTPDRNQAEITLITAGGAPAGLDGRNERKHQEFLYQKMEELFKRNGMVYSGLKTEKLKKDPAW